MPTTYTDQFFIIDPYSPPAAGTAMTFNVYDLIDQNDDGDIDLNNDDSVDGQDVISSWPGDTVTVNVPGVGNITYTGTTLYLADGRQVFTPTDGQALQNGTLVGATGVTTQGPLNVSDLGPICFTPGTLIDTPEGARRIETLCVGDAVLTRDHGAQPIRWIGAQSICGKDEFAPVRFETGAVGNDAPLVVSPNHRVLVSGWQAELFCGVDEVLVAAKHLVNGLTVRIVPCETVTYLHLLCDAHEIVSAHGVWSESLYPAALQGHADRGTLREIRALFPELLVGSRTGAGLARPMAKGFEAAMLAA
ncbi:Hint domain-containing protein [Rhodobacteraceae bacterium D3-12]|nr:Hint domain-containing protein [Rhodobacteraceae bacterium D3-12]